MTARVYVPATLGLLAGLVEDGLLEPGAPEGVDRLVAEDDSEDAEYAALMAAADASRDLLDGPGRRVVVVAELADPDGAVPLGRVVAVHVDDHDDAADDDDLGWYATQEVGRLLG